MYWQYVSNRLNVPAGVSKQRGQGLRFGRFLALTILLFSWTGMPVTAQTSDLDAPARHLPAPCLSPGFECFQVAEIGTWVFGGEAIPPLPPDFFGPGSDPFIGLVLLTGGSEAGDVLVFRPEGVCRDPDQQDHLLPVPIEIVQLHLRSVEPIAVPGYGLWDLEITNSMPTPGHITLDNWEPGAGGWLCLELLVQPLYVFTQLEPPFEVITFDSGEAGMPPVPLSTTVGDPVPWVEFGLWGPCSVNGIVGAFLDSEVPEPCSVSFSLAAPDGESVTLALRPYHVLPACGPPPHDECDTPLVLSGDVRVRVNTLFATPSGPGGFIVGPNLWYAYAAETTGVLRVDTCGSAFETLIAVYDMPPCEPGAVPVATSDDYPLCLLGTRLHVEVEAGQMLWIEIGGLHGTTGLGWLGLSLNDDPCMRDVTPFRPLRFDTNYDAAIDLHDFAAAQVCFTGSDPLGAPTPLCEWHFNTGVEEDVDFEDMTVFFASMTGPAQPGEPTTAPLAPLCPAEGVLTNDGRPGFAWNPCDHPGEEVRYRLQAHLVPEGMSPDVAVELMGPYLVVDDLAQPWANYPTHVAPLLPGRTYAWQVEAYSAFDPTAILCSGPANTLKTQPATSLEQLDELLKELERIRQELEQAQDDLENNPFVKEIRLIELIGSILRGEVDLGEEVMTALEAFIRCDEEALNEIDAEKLDKALATLQAIIKLVLAANDDITPASRAALEALIAEIQKVRDGLQDLQTIKEFFSPDFDVWQYLQKQIEEGLKKAIKDLAEKALAKVAGKKAAGAIVSIVLDLYAFGDFLFNIMTIEDLRRAWNIVMLEAIKAASGAGYGIPCDHTWRGNYVWVYCSAYNNAEFRIQPLVRCWRPAESGNPGEGQWVDCTASFTQAGKPSYSGKEGATRIEFETGDMEVVASDPSPHRRYHFSVKWDPDCVGSGPCYLGIVTEIKKEDGTQERVLFLLGVKSPGGG